MKETQRQGSPKISLLPQMPREIRFGSPERIFGGLMIRWDRLFGLAGVVVIVSSAGIDMELKRTARGLGVLGELLADFGIDLFIVGGEQHQNGGGGMVFAFDGVHAAAGVLGESGAESWIDSARGLIAYSGKNSHGRVGPALDADTVRDDAAKRA
jgi:hypothetical protein